MLTLQLKLKECLKAAHNKDEITIPFVEVQKYHPITFQKQLFGGKHSDTTLFLQASSLQL
jgi:hypothetical protein